MCSELHFHELNPLQVDACLRQAGCVALLQVGDVMLTIGDYKVKSVEQVILNLPPRLIAANKLFLILALRPLSF